MLNNYVATLAGAGATGGSGGILLADLTVFDFGGVSTAAEYQLTSGGEIRTFTSSFGVLPAGDWASPKSLAPGSYEVRVDLGPGSASLASGTTGSWLALTSDQAWRLTRNLPGASDSTLLVQIRLGGTVLTSATVTLACETGSL
jgi:hypothetical protein